MGKLAISCNEISKRYWLGEDDTAFTIVEKISSLMKGEGLKGKPREEFWALRDISFELEEGSVLGLIGRNGAGKSTLLKVLSRITTPTSGSFGYNGRIASLLEVGSGFKQELTGRDNIYLSGSILGMTREMVNKQLDAIVDFAELDRFLDTPIKRYSSGMYTRLAFSVAAHLEADILMIDEVLAVGDQKFQKKCLEKMNQVASRGRTVIFVSHNVDAVRQLCEQGLLLSKGQIHCRGEIESVVEEYERMNRELSNESSRMEFPNSPGARAQIRSIEFVDKDDTTFDITESMNTLIEIECHEDFDDLKLSLMIRCLDGQIVLESTLQDWDDEYSGSKDESYPLSKGLHRFCCTIPSPLLNIGLYEVAMYLVTTSVDYHHAVTAQTIQIVDRGNALVSIEAMERRRCLITPKLKWSKE